VRRRGDEMTNRSVISSTWTLTSYRYFTTLLIHVNGHFFSFEFVSSIPSFWLSSEPRIQRSQDFPSSSSPVGFLDTTFPVMEVLFSISDFSFWIQESGRITDVRCTMRHLRFPENRHEVWFILNFQKFFGHNWIFRNYRFLGILEFCILKC